MRISQNTNPQTDSALAEAPLSELSPAEIFQQHADGLINADTMISELASRTYTADKIDPNGGDGVIRGSWRLIEAALVAGLLTDSQYMQIAEISGSLES